MWYIVDDVLGDVSDAIESLDEANVMISEMYGDWFDCDNHEDLMPPRYFLEWRL